MICPVCHIPMIVVEHQKIEIDYCVNCQGVWFDCGELELLLQKSASQVNCLPDKGIIRSSDVRTTEKKRKCPICGRKMDKNLIGEKPKILIDVCPRGEGLWFDGGELGSFLKQLQGEKDEGEVLGFLKDVFQTPAEPKLSNKPSL
ncbi:MAG: zf-TFIIB domain-containing protein [Chloroflexota bacterium]